MKPIQQAEAELRTTALAFVAAEAAYMKACDVERERDPDFWKPEKSDALSPQWHTACDALTDARRTMEDAAKALAAAEKGEAPAQEQPVAPQRWAPDGMIDGGYDAGPVKEDR